MSKTEVTARALVTITLEIPVDGTWGDDCTVGQVNKQALDSLRNIMNTCMVGRQGTGHKPTLPHGTKMIGEPQVKQVLVRRER